MATSQLDATTFDDEPDSLAKISVGRQALRRAVNERIAAFSEKWDPAEYDVFCECGRAKCADRVTISATTYEELRRVPSHFLVKLGHTERADRVVGEYDEFVIVEKFGAPGLRAVSLERRLGRSA